MKKGISLELRISKRLIVNMGQTLAVIAFTAAIARAPLGDISPTSSVEAQESPGQTDSRSGPLEKLDEAAIPLAPGRTSVLLYNYLLRKNLAEGVKPILLQIPPQYLHLQQKPMQVWGINILAFFPAMTGPFTEENKAFVNCANYCNGRVLISLTGAAGDEKTIAEKFVDRISASLPRGQDFHIGYKIEKAQISGFDEAYKERTYIPGPGHLHDKIIYIRHSSSSAEELIAECDDPLGVSVAPFPLCEAVLDLGTAPGVAVKYIFPEVLLSHWDELQKKVATLVRDFYR